MESKTCVLIWCLTMCGLIAVIGVHLFMRWLQSKDVAAGRIPARGGLIQGTNLVFLHMQDIAVMTWGDCVGISQVWIAGLLCIAEAVGAFGPMSHVLWKLVVAGIMGVGTTILFYTHCMAPIRKPDWHHPRPGVLSRAGKVHIGFLGVSVFLGVFSLARVVELWLNQIEHWLRTPLTALWFCGMLIWVCMFLWDATRGKFDPLFVGRVNPE